MGDSYANVIKLDKDLVTLQVFSGTQGVSTTDPVRFLGRPMMVSFSDHLLGRIFDGAGVPRDNGPALTENMIPIGGPSVNPSRRIVPNKLIRTGIPMIDVFNTLVESQKLPIFSVSGEPYNQLLSRIAMQAQVDIIVLGGMGLKYDDYLYFRDTLEKSGAMGRTVMFIHTASDPTVECTLVPDMALAVAEQFALAGKRVLVLLTDMTNYADAQKEMAITMEQVPSNRGYPGDLYSCLAARYEKAVDFEGAGSITILGVTTMPGDDVTLDRYKSVFGFAIGSPDLYDWIRENPGVVTYPISYCNDPSIVGKIDNFVSINNCISVDLYGQICAESAGTRQISGTGGQLDFLESAAVSKGGKAFICLTSSFTNKEGEMVSRINPLLTPGDIVTDPRSLAYYIVTEYGGVNLVGCSTWERAEKLISIAHPKFRDELIANAEKQGIWLRSNKR